MHLCIQLFIHNLITYNKCISALIIKIIYMEQVGTKKQKEGLKNGGMFLKTGWSMRYTHRGSLRSQKPRFRYRPPHPRRVVDGLLLVGDQNEGGMFFKTGWSMRYTHRGTLVPRKPRFRYRPPRPRRVVDGLLLVGDQNGGGRFLKTGWSMRYTRRGTLGPQKSRFR